MKKLATLIFVTAVLAALGSAQGFGFFGGGGGAAAEYSNLRRTDVRKDLKVTEDQASKLNAAQADMQGQMRQVFQDAQGDRDAMQAGMKKLMDGLGAKIKEILTPEQQKRLHEINIQMQGPMAATDPETQKSLKLKDAQVKEIKDLQAKQQAANASLFQKVQDGELDRTEIQGMMAKNADALKAAIDKVLTDEQKAQLKTLGGAKFEQDPNEKPQGFGGRPPGGGGGGN